MSERISRNATSCIAPYPTLQSAILEAINTYDRN